MYLQKGISCLFILIAAGCSRGDILDRLDLTAETVRGRVLAPEGYSWVQEPEGSFGAFLQDFPLERHGTKILDFRNKPIRHQSDHVAVLRIDVGSKDLQQCADAIIRLRAEYLWQQKRYDEIRFQFTSGDVLTWNDYKNGIRPRVSPSNQVRYIATAPFDDTYANFRRYLETVFIYAGTISLNRETVRIGPGQDIRPGDLLVTPGSPGHAVLVIGQAVNSRGEKKYLLAQGNTPAQSIHLLANPYSRKYNPWYALHPSRNPTITARYVFKKTTLRRWQ